MSQTPQKKMDPARTPVRKVRFFQVSCQRPSTTGTNGYEMMWSNKIITVATLIGLGISIASFVGQVEGNAKTAQGLRLAVDANQIAQEPDVTADGIYQLKMYKWCARNPVGTSSQYS
jgi:hypothetical protein